MKRLTIPVLLWIIISLTACQGMMARSEMPIMPTKPPLKIEQRKNGGICLDKENTYLLYDYILRLEEGYK